jgi:hypothetical protein
MYRGRADLSVAMYKMNLKEGEEHRAWGEEFRRVHPKDSGPIDAGSFSASAYRNVFIGKIASDISKMFVAYEPEKHAME